MTSARQIYLGSRRGPALPYDAEVEYIAATGTQWIATPWKPDMTADLSIVGKAGFTANNYRGVLISAYNANGGASNLSVELNDNYKFRVYALGDVFTQFACINSTYSLFPFEVSYQAGTGLLTGTANGITKTGTVAAGARIVNTKTANMAADDQLRFKQGVLGPIKVSNPDLVLDMIPVRFTNELGQSEGAMYDRVSGQLFRNAGKGAFVFGTDIAGGGV